VAERRGAAKRALQVFGSNIRTARKAQNLTLVDLAEQFQSHENYLAGVERAERNMSVLNLFYLSAALGKHPAEFFEGITIEELRKLPAKSPRRLRSERRRR